MNIEALGLTENKERYKEALVGGKEKMCNYIIISKFLKSKKQTDLVWAGLDVLPWFPWRPKEGIRSPRIGVIKQLKTQKFHVFWLLWLYFSSFLCI